MPPQNAPPPGYTEIAAPNGPPAGYAEIARPVSSYAPSPSWAEPVRPIQPMPQGGVPSLMPQTQPRMVQGPVGLPVYPTNVQAPPQHTTDELDAARKAIAGFAPSVGAFPYTNLSPEDQAKQNAAYQTLSEANTDPENSAAHPFFGGMAKGLGYAGNGPVDFLPAIGMSLIGGPALARLGTLGPAGDLITRVASATMAAQQGANAVEKVPEIVHALRNQNFDRAEELAGQGGVEAIFAGLAAYGTRGASDDISQMRSIYDAWSTRRANANFTVSDATQPQLGAAPPEPPKALPMAPERPLLPPAPEPPDVAPRPLGPLTHDDALAEAITSIPREVPKDTMFASIYSGLKPSDETLLDMQLSSMYEQAFKKQVALPQSDERTDVQHLIRLIEDPTDVSWYEGTRRDARARLVALTLDPEHAEAANLALQYLATPKTEAPLGPQASAVHELPRPLGQSIKTPLPPREEETVTTAQAIEPVGTPTVAQREAPQPPQAPLVTTKQPDHDFDPVTTVTSQIHPYIAAQPGTADPTLIPPKLVNALTRMAKIRAAQTAPLAPNVHAALEREGVGLKPRVDNETFKWFKYLQYETPKAVQSLRDKADAIGDDSVGDSPLGFLKRSIEQHDQIETQRKTARSLRHEPVANAVNLQRGEGLAETTPTTMGIEISDAISASLGQPRPSRGDVPDDAPEYVRNASNKLKSIQKYARDIFEGTNPEMEGADEEMKMQLLEDLNRDAEDYRKIIQDYRKDLPKSERPAKELAKPKGRQREADEPHVGLPYITQKMWETTYGAKKHSARPSLAQKIAKRAEMSTTQRLQRWVANRLEGFHGKLPPKSEAGMTTAGAVGAVAAAGTGATIGGAIGGPIGAAVGAVVGGGAALAPWGDITREMGELLQKTGTLTAEAVRWMKDFAYGVSDNPYVSDPMFKGKAESNRAMNYIRKATAAYWDAGERLTKAEATAIYDASKSGNWQGIPQEWQDYFNNVHGPIDEITLRDANQAIADRAAATGASFNPVPFLDNHNRINWKKPAAGSTGDQWLSGGSKVYGSTSFKKQHVFTDFSQGIAAGLEPISWNPVENDYRTWQNIQRYTSFLNTQTHFIKEAKLGGVGFIYSPTGSRPLGYNYEVNGPGMNVMFPAASGEGLVQAGKWYSNDAGLATMFRNATSPDKIASSRAGRLFFAVAHPIATMKLFGPFHAFLMMNVAQATSMRFGLTNIFDGLEQLNGAKVARGLMDIAKTPLASLTYAYKGRQLQHEEFRLSSTAAGQAYVTANPGSAFLVDLLWNAGLDNAFKTPERGFWDELKGRPFPHYFTQSWTKVADAWAKKNYLEASGRLAAQGAMTLPAFTQSAMELIFKYYVPMLKAGLSQADLANELEHRKQDLYDGYVTPGQLARDVVNRQENFLGELNTENLYANHTFMGALQVIYRALSFRFGTVRGATSAITGQLDELTRALPGKAQLAIGGGGANKYPRGGGAPTAAPGQPGGASIPRQRVPKMNSNVAQFLAYFMLNAAWAAIWYKARGKKLPDPVKEPSKYIAPGTGYLDDRGKEFQFNIPSYAQQFYSLGHDPTGYALGGRRDLFQQLQESIDNKNFDGTWVADPRDPMLHQLAYRTAHALVPDTLIPGGFLQSNVKRMTQTGQPKGLAWGLALGVGASPAPRYISETPAESKAIQLGALDLPEGPADPANFARGNAMREIESMVRNKFPNSDINKTFNQYSKNGTLRPDDDALIESRLEEPYLNRLVSRLDLKSTLAVAEAGNAEERKMLQDIIADKFDNELPRITDPHERQDLINRANALYRKPQAKK